MYKSEFFGLLKSMPGYALKKIDIFNDVLDLYSDKELDRIWHSIYVDSFTFTPKPHDIKNRADKIGIIKNYTGDENAKYYYRCKKCKAAFYIRSGGCPQCKALGPQSVSFKKSFDYPKDIIRVKDYCWRCDDYNPRTSLGPVCKDWGIQSMKKQCATCVCKKCCRAEIKNKKAIKEWTE